MSPLAPRFAALLGALLLALPATTDALERSCGPDPLANTADVLCAPPSGPCDDATVRVPVGLDVLAAGGGCVFDLGGRALAVDATIQTPANLRFLNAGDVTVGATGKLKARGDFLRAAGDLDDGGTIEIRSAGTIALAGLLDVSGFTGGVIELDAAGAILIRPGAAVRGNALGPLEDGERSGSGGDLLAEARGGHLVVEGPIELRGQAFGFGGDCFVAAARNLTVDAVIDVSGGIGGAIDGVAGDRLAVRRSLFAHSSGGGGYGGDVYLSAVDLPLSGFLPSAPGAEVTVEAPAIDVRGSATDASADSGGFFDVFSNGSIVIGPQTTVQLDGGPGPGGDAGSVDLTADADVVMAGTLSAHGDAVGGGSFFGLEFFAGRNLLISGRAETSGGEDGGGIGGFASGEIVLTGVIRAVGTTPTATGGRIEFIAGFASDARLVVAADVVATGGAAAQGGDVFVAGCRLDVRPGRLVDTRAGAAVPNDRILLASRHPMLLGAGSRYRVGAAGEIELHYPTGADPLIGPGVVFDQPPVHLVTDPFFLECPPPVCGNGVPEPGEECDDGNADDGDGCAADCRVRCRAEPVPACHAPVAPDDAKLVVKNDYPGDQHRLDWSWRGAAVTRADLGSPATDDDYVLCVYDESGPPALVLDARVPAAGLCAGKPCWRSQGADRIRYRSPGRLPDGVDTLKLQAGATGKARVDLKAKGSALETPSLPLGLPARVQLQSEHGTCWEATYTSAQRNDGARFKAASP